MDQSGGFTPSVKRYVLDGDLTHVVHKETKKGNISYVMKSGLRCRSHTCDYQEAGNRLRGQCIVLQE